MKGNGSMIRLRVGEFICIKMEPHIQDNGKMINSMDMESKNGQMALFMKVTLSKD